MRFTFIIYFLLEYSYFNPFFSDKHFVEYNQPIYSEFPNSTDHIIVENRNSVGLPNKFYEIYFYYVLFSRVFLF